MAGSVNKVILVGNLGADPEVRRTQDGRPIVNLSVATSESWRDRQSGDWSDGEALWLGCRAYGEYADNIAATSLASSR